MAGREVADDSIRTASFYRAAGIAGIAAGMVTAAIIVLPYFYGNPSSFEARLELHGDFWYSLRLWFSFLNIFAILLAALGLTLNRFRWSPGAASTGMLFLLFYGAAELLSRSIMIFTREYRWIHDLADADPELRMELLESIQGFDAAWAGVFPLILMTYTLASFLFGFALRGGDGLQRATSVILFAAGVLGLVTFLAPYVSWLRPVATWGYVLIQPTSRIMIGVFLLREAATAGRDDEATQAML